MTKHPFTTQTPSPPDRTGGMVCSRKGVERGGLVGGHTTNITYLRVDDSLTVTSPSPGTHDRNLARLGGLDASYEYSTLTHFRHFRLLAFRHPLNEG